MSPQVTQGLTIHLRMKLEAEEKPLTLEGLDRSMVVPSKRQATFRQRQHRVAVGRDRRKRVFAQSLKEKVPCPVGGKANLYAAQLPSPRMPLHNTPQGPAQQLSPVADPQERNLAVSAHGYDIQQLVGEGIVLAG